MPKIGFDYTGATNRAAWRNTFTGLKEITVNGRRCKVTDVAFPDGDKVEVTYELNDEEFKAGWIRYLWYKVAPDGKTRDWIKGYMTSEHGWPDGVTDQEITDALKSR